MLDHRPELVLGRQIDADLQFAGVALFDPGAPAVTAGLLVHDIARHLASGHCFGEDRAQ